MNTIVYNAPPKVSGDERITLSATVTHSDGSSETVVLDSFVGGFQRTVPEIQRTLLGRENPFIEEFLSKYEWTITGTCYTTSRSTEVWIDERGRTVRREKLSD